MKTEKEIIDAINEINDNSELLFGYREDIVAVLRWVLNQGEIDGLKELKKEQEII